MKTDMKERAERQQIRKRFRTGDLSIEQRDFFLRNTISWICTKQMFTIDIRYPPGFVHNFFVDNVDNFVNNWSFNKKRQIWHVDKSRQGYTQIVNKYLPDGWRVKK